MDRVKKSSIQALEEEAKAKRAAMAALEGTTPAAMWLQDLDTFKEAWTTYKELREEEMKGEGGSAVPVVKKKRAVVVRKKAAATAAVAVKA